MWKSFDIFDSKFKLKFVFVHSKALLSSAAYGIFGYSPRLRVPVSPRQFANINFRVEEFRRHKVMTDRGLEFWKR